MVHDRQAIGHRERLFLVVSDVQEGDSDLLLQRTQLDLERAAELGVKRPEGLVEQQTDGRSTSARASATRCCWPPESWLVRRFSYPESWTSSSASFTRVSRSDFGTDLYFRPKATFSATVRNGNGA